MKKLIFGIITAFCVASQAFAQVLPDGGPGPGPTPLATPVSPANGGTGTANTANLAWPSSGGTAALLGANQTFSAANIFSVAGAASTPAVSLTGAPFASATGANNPPLLALITTGASAATWSTLGTYIGVNAVSGSTSPFLDLRVNGVAKASIAADGSISATALTLTSGIVIGSAGAIFWSGKGALYSGAANNIVIGSTDSASPSAQSLTVPNVVAGTSNTAGASPFAIIGSRSTGSGTSGDIVLQTGGTGAAATAQNSAVTAMTIKGASQHVAFGGSAPTLSSCGGGSPALNAAANDNAGIITTGTTATSCTLTFKTAYSAAPACVFWDETAAVNLTSATKSASAVVLTLAANSGNLIDYICHGS